MAPNHKLGRLAPDPSKPRLKLGRYLTGRIPPNPTAVDWLTRVRSWPMYANDQIGDCTCAAVGHIIQALSTYARGSTITVTERDVIDAYAAVSGYDPATGEGDNGAVLQDVLNYWRKTGVGGHTIYGFAEVDVSNRAEVDAAVNLFGHVLIGFNVPQSAMDQVDAGQDWDVVTSAAGRKMVGEHAVNIGVYNTPGRTDTCVTWGQLQRMTDAFWSKYVDEAWVVLSPEWLAATGLSPQGLDLYQLGEDLSTLTKTPNPIPAPGPSPSPGPQPPSPSPSPSPNPTPTPTPGPSPAPVPTPPPGLLQDILACVHRLEQLIARWLGK